MHFITFPVQSTNIFPITNSSNGGNLLSEFNLRSRETIMTDPSIPSSFGVGPSYTHSMLDYEVGLLSDVEAPEYDPTKIYSVGDYCTVNSTEYVCISAYIKAEPTFDSTKWNPIALSTSIIQIAPGKAIVNGHYVESLKPMTIDLTLANAQLKQASQKPLSGHLSIGLRVYYSEDTTMAGSMLVENEKNMYVGVQVVILPKEEFITPEEATTFNDITAHLKLADFIFLSGSVSQASIVQAKSKITSLSAARIGGFNKLLDDNYIARTGLDYGRLYTFTGQDPEGRYNAWCDSTDALMIWDNDYNQHITTSAPTINEAQFVTGLDEKIALAVPHKQLDGMHNSSGVRTYYAPKVYSIPQADYDSETPGTITGSYTREIKNIAEKLSTYKTFVNGKQIMYLESINSDYEFETDLSNYEPGDYILVREDYTQNTSEDIGGAPSTMYVVIPGAVTAVEFAGTTKPSGVKLGVREVLWEGDGTDVPTETNPTDSELRGYFNYTDFRGNINDYFCAEYHDLTDDTLTVYYWKVIATGFKSWSGAIKITGGIPFADTNQVGGFYNVDYSTALDAGYVYRDDTGRLRLVDYALLRSGALAYQLGEDITLPTNITVTEIQGYLDDYVNSRVAFPLRTTLSSTPNMINVTITIPSDESGEEINIYNVDSRFGTGMYLHILGEATSSTVINIIDCAKVRIDPNIKGNPTIRIIRSNLYYDSSVYSLIRQSNLNTSFTGFKDFTIWYDKFNDDDPEILVSGMEVSQPNANTTMQDIDFWSSDIRNDNHYQCALKSVSFDGDGNIVDCSMYLSNNSTIVDIDDVQTEFIIGGPFQLPQGSDLNYPRECLTKPLKVTGTFTTAYQSGVEKQWVVMDTAFTAQTGSYGSATGITDGTLSFHTKTSILDTRYVTVSVIDGWKPGSYHIFYGGTTV